MPVPQTPKVSYYTDGGLPIFSITNEEQQSYWIGLNAFSLSLTKHDVERLSETLIQKKEVMDSFWDGYLYGHERDDYNDLIVAQTTLSL